MSERANWPPKISAAERQLGVVIKPLNRQWFERNGGPGCERGSAPDRRPRESVDGAELINKPLAAVGIGQRSGKRDRPTGKRGQKYKTKPITAAGPQLTSFRQIEANRRNACKSTGPITEEGKQRSRCNAVRHGLTAETVIGALEDAEDYQAFDAAIIADYDAQSTVERELVLRLASLLWRLRRATTMETGLFNIQADYLRDFRQGRQIQ